MNETRFERLTWLLLSFFAYALLFMARGQSCSVGSPYPGGVHETRYPQTETMHSFILRTARSLGEAEPVVRAATRALLRSLQNQLAPPAFELLSRRIPGVRSLLSEGDRVEHAGAPACAWEDVGDVHGSLVRVGLPAHQIGRFTSAFVDFLREEGGERVVSNVLRELPELGPAG